VLRSPAAAVLLVTTPDWTGVRTVDALAGAFAAERVEIAGLIGNRFWPETPREGVDPAAWAEEVKAQAERVAGLGPTVLLPQLAGEATGLDSIERLAALLGEMVSA